MNLKKSHVISISLSPTMVKAAQFSRAGALEKIAKKSVDKVLVDVALRQALMGFDLKSADILCAIPGDVATAKNIEVPSTDNEEIESILALQAARHTPFSKEEILTSYIKLGSPKPNFTRVLLVVVKRDAVKEKLLIMKNAGVSPETVVFVPEAIASFYGKALIAKKGAAPVAIIDINLQSTTLIVSLNGAAAMSRNISVGVESLVVDAEASKQLVDEIKTSLEIYEQEGIGGRPGKVILTSAHPGLSGIKDTLAAALGLGVDVEPYTKFVNAPKTVKESLLRDFADDSALDLISTGTSVSRCQAELIPQEMREVRSASQKLGETLKAGVLIVIALFLIGGAMAVKVSFKQKFLEKNLIAKYAEQRQEVQNLESLIAKTRVLRQYLEARDLPLEAIREINRIIPSEIYLSSVSMDEAGDLSLQGVSESMSKVFNFVTALEESPLFDAVKTKSTATKKDKGKDVATFEIVMKVVSVLPDAPAADVKKDEKK